MAARDMGNGFDRTQYGLRPVHCTGMVGYIWVRVAEVPPEFAAQAGPYLKPHHLENAKVAFESTIIERANWKRVWENNRERYHCPGNHSALSSTFPAGPTVAIQP